jgi:diguanylate cyclase (GGDEF)-like protein/PAS domain S-box-containing protein
VDNVRRSSRAALFAGALTAAFLALVASGFAGDTVTIWIDDLGLCAAALLATVACAWAARRGAGRAWVWLAASAGMWAAGQAVWAVQELSGHNTPFGTAADIFFLAAAPLALGGLLLMPSGVRSGSVARSAVDAAMIAGSIVGAAWGPLLEPLIHGRSPDVTFGLGIAYTAASIAVVVAAFWVAEHVASGYRRPVAYVVAGVVVISAANAAFGLLAATGRYTTGHALDASWLLGFLLVAVAAVSVVEQAGADRAAEPPRLHAVLTIGTYLPLAVLTASAMTERLLTGAANGVLVTLLIPVVALTVVRQALIHVENARLTERLQAEMEQHRRAEEQLATAQQVAHLGSWAWDADTGAVSWSDEEYRLLGLEPGTIAPSYEAFVSRIHPEDRADAEAQIAGAARVRGAHELTTRIVRPDGEIRWIRSQGRFVPTEGGTGKIVGTSLDITEARRAEQEVLEAEMRFQLGFEHSSVGMAMVDPDGHVTRANAAFCGLVGLPFEDVIGRPTLDFMHPRDAPIMADLRARMLADADQDTQQAEVRYLRPDGSIVWVHITVSLVRDHDGVPLYFFGQLQDVTARREAEARLAYQAHHDMLTGVANRAALLEAVQEAVPRGAALVVLDLEGFKQINDGLGHEVGDLVLQEVARRLEHSTRGTDLVARIGGDEFAVLLPGVVDESAASRVAASLLTAMDPALPVHDIALHVGASAGIAVTTGGETAGTLMRRADLAMHRAREEGSGWAVYRPSDDQDVAARLAFVADLRAAIDADRIGLHFQPKVDVETGAVLGVEALARWEDPDRAPVSPAEFITVAEQTGLILPLTKGLLDQALTQWSLWRAEGIVVDIAVNLSPRVLLDPELIEWVSAALVMHDVPGRRLILEITESSLAEGEQVIRAMAALRRLGVKLAVDDLGTGYSSLVYLKELPVDELKIDRSFIRYLHEDARDRAIVTAICALGRSLGLTVVAEGVEEAEGLAVLRELGCPVAQGYYCCRPKPGVELTAWLSERTAQPATR